MGKVIRRDNVETYGEVIGRGSGETYGKGDWKGYWRNTLGR